ncbi:MAG: hypothetical protein GX616_02595, partial [Planctomycetes bacterium]|nr:hypothetical protein [Planctomycetota bacterium]
PLTQVDRSSLSELGELTAAVAEIQERVDRAGTGLSPLGLIPNVVPFGINAAELGPGTGRSHYEQVRDAAVNALNNAREVLGYANQANQRLREQAETQDQFAEQIEDTEADFTNRLIEVFGYPSRSDMADNDFDPSTTDQQEAESAPDLVNFMLDDAELASRGYEPRAAPGEVQLAFAEMKLALRRIEEAADALSNLTKQIEDLQDFREFLAAQGQDLTSIVDQFGNKQADLKTTLIDAEQDTIDAQFYAAWGIKTAASLVVGGLAGAAGFGDAEKICWGGAIAGAISYGAISGMDMWLADLAKQEEDNQFDYDRAQEQLNVWKDVQLQMADIDIQNQEKFLELQSLVRQLPQYRLNVRTAKDNHLTAVGRLKSAIQRGNRLIAERDRIRKLRRDQLQEYRWGDLAYRNFRNNALQKYDAFFTLAARYVMLAGRAYAYEYNSRDQAYLILDSINRERMLGNPVGSSGGLQGVITDLDNFAQVNKFNTPLTSVGQRSFSLRTHMLGLPGDSTGNLKFRGFLERQIVQNLQELPAMQDFAQVSVAAHHGPAIMVPFFSEVAGNNFFGNGPDAPYGGANFPVSLNTKLRNFAIRLQGVDADALGIDPDNAYVSVFLMPLGQSVLRENTNAPTVEENEPRAWSVVDQWLPAPPLVSVQNPAVQDRYFSPWVSTANSGGNYLNAIKRFRETEAQIDLGQPIEFKSELAGRSVWNTQWMLVIPGKQWTANADPNVIRNRLMTFIYGATGSPAADTGITDIRIVMQAYAN